MSDKARSVIDAIEKAFGGVRLEDGVSLREAIVLDNYGTDEERQRARLQDEPEDWRKIPDETIADYSASLAFLDAKGMRFYLPAFMCFAVRNYQHSDSASIDYTLYTLDLSPGSGAETVDLVFEKATEEQRTLLETAISPAELKAKLESLDDYRAERLRLLTAVQWDAIRKFLEFMVAEAADRVDCRVARRALERLRNWPGGGRAAPPSKPGKVL